MNSPLGKYSQAVASVVALGVIFSAIAMRFMGISDPFVDNVALIAVGAVFGAAASTSANGFQISAAHRRLDLMAAPAADSLEDSATQPLPHRG